MVIFEKFRQIPISHFQHIFLIIISQSVIGQIITGYQLLNRLPKTAQRCHAARFSMQYFQRNVPFILLPAMFGT